MTVAGYQHLRLCAPCRAAVDIGEVTLHDASGEELAGWLLRTAPHPAVSVEGIEAPVTRVDVARMALRLLLALGAGNRDGESGSWPQEVTLPAMVRQEPKVEEPSPRMLAHQLYSRFTCRGCETVLELHEDSGELTCPMCGQYTYRCVGRVMSNATGWQPTHTVYIEASSDA